ncbi:GNAT family N-acetyltransferase [Psychrobacter pygoscelis]|uniref:GNAT family N-acetyltransferase n=1 Tax=Psychrobacter pygoscelis TaxID=2488563 RepID=UPI00103C7C33|nr:GNAT family N-acetyltransferase [Psychrobacter pygoscelis]
MNFYWVEKTLSDRDQQQLLFLANHVAQNEKTVGFHEKLTRNQEKIYISNINLYINSTTHGFLVARNNDEIIFHVLISLKNEPNAQHIANASKVIAHPAYRGKKIFRRALFYITQYCEEHGAVKLLLDARKGTSAEEIWKHMGFIEWGVLPGYAKVDNVEIDGSFMYQSIDYLKSISIAPMRLQ